jgi:hypothetical protein
MDTDQRRTLTVPVLVSDASPSEKGHLSRQCDYQIDIVVEITALEFMEDTEPQPGRADVACIENVEKVASNYLHLHSP